MRKNIQWLAPVLICIIASVASVFLPVLTYVYPNGDKVSFNVFGFTEPSTDLLEILATYDGPFNIYFPNILLTVAAVVAVLAIIAAFVGVITMSLQRPNTWQFVLALIGIIGTAIPAIILIIAAPISRHFFPGTFQFGIYPIITPITMGMCMFMVTRKHKRTKAQLLAAEKAKGLIRPAGDL